MTAESRARRNGCHNKPERVSHYRVQDGRVYQWDGETMLRHARMRWQEDRGSPGCGHPTRGEDAGCDGCRWR